MTYDDDIHFMRSAINMARRGVGLTADNPSVGCVIVKDGYVIARARTANGGRPHAEPQAIQAAGESTHNATMYVTLEPCAHHGNTPPCVDAIIESKIARVVIGVVDPDPRTASASITALRNAGIDVSVGVLEDLCNDVIKGFRSRIERDRPFVTLKCACTLDGKIACANGESKWITQPQARARLHHLRVRHDAILVGVNTAIMDNPSLTARVAGVNHGMTRVILDRTLRLSLDSQLMQSARLNPLVIYTEEQNTQQHSAAGARVIQANCTDIGSVLQSLAELGINNLLVEGGAQIHASFLKAKLFDTLVIYRAPTMLGAEAKSVVSDLNIDTLAQRIDLETLSLKQVGADHLEIYATKD